MVQVHITSLRGHAKAVCGCGFQSVKYNGLRGASLEAEDHRQRTHHSWTYPKVVPYSGTAEEVFPTMEESDRREMM